MKYLVPVLLILLLAGCDTVNLSESGTELSGTWVSEYWTPEAGERDTMTIEVSSSGVVTGEIVFTTHVYDMNGTPSEAPHVLQIENGSYADGILRFDYGEESEWSQSVWWDVKSSREMVGHFRVRVNPLNEDEAVYGTEIIRYTRAR